MLKIVHVLSHSCFIALLASTCVACGSSQSPQSQSLGSYSAQVNQFVSDAVAHGKSVDISNLVVQVGALPSSTSSVTVGGVTETTSESDVGMCVFTASGPTVTISAEAAQTYGPESLEALIFHELGHCLLLLDHNSSINADGSPTSIMHPSGVDGLTYENNRAAYLNELFSEQPGSSFQGGG